MRPLVPLLLLLSALGGTGCQPANPYQDAEQRVLSAFRADFGGAGRREPWTTKQSISPDGDWVVREIRNLRADTREEPLDPGDRRRGVEWRGQVLVTYWSRVVDAGAWRGPELPSSWDQFAVPYRLARVDGRLEIERAAPATDW